MISRIYHTAIDSAPPRPVAVALGPPPYWDTEVHRTSRVAPDGTSLPNASPVSKRILRCLTFRHRASSI